MAKVLSEGFDPAWRLLLFCEGANFAYAPDGPGSIVEFGKKLLRIWQEIHWIRK